MPSTYYQIELSARALTALLVVLALLMILAFVFGYGAAWSVLSGGGEQPPLPARVTMVAPTAVVPSPTALVLTPTAEPSLAATLPEASPTAPAPFLPTATPWPELPVEPTPAPSPRPTPSPEPTAEPKPAAARFWVQVVAAGNRRVVTDTRKKLERLGFPSDHQRVLEERAANGRPVYKVRVGPLPDRDSANRVVQRLKAGGFRDAWIVLP